MGAARSGNVGAGEAGSPAEEAEDVEATLVSIATSAAAERANAPGGGGGVLRLGLECVVPTPCADAGPATVASARGDFLAAARRRQCQAEAAAVDFCGRLH